MPRDTWGRQDERTRARYPIARRTVLEHPMRQGILRAVRARPGQGAQALAEVLGTDWKTVVHHARVLASLGHLEVREGGGRRWFFPVEGGGVLKDVVAATAAATAARIVAHAYARPGCTVHALGVALGVAPSTLRWHVGRLAEQRILVEAGAGWAVAPQMREAVAVALAARGEGGG